MSRIYKELCESGAHLREVFLEDHAVIVGLFGQGSVERVHMLGMLQHLIRNLESDHSNNLVLVIHSWLCTLS